MLVQLTHAYISEPFGPQCADVPQSHYRRGCLSGHCKSPTCCACAFYKPNRLPIWTGYPRLPAQPRNSRRESSRGRLRFVEERDCGRPRYSAQACGEEGKEGGEGIREDRGCCPDCHRREERGRFRRVV